MDRDLDILSITDSVFLDNNLDQRKRYECPVCEHLLRDAVQTSCGHWACLSCASELFSASSTLPCCPRVDCGEQLEIEDGKEYFPDKFVRREIGKFLVRCRFHGNNCPWTGPLSDQSKHIATCTYAQKKCTHCKEYFSKDELAKHESNCPKALMVCPFAEYGCDITKQMTRAECDSHLETNVANHSKLMATMLQVLKQQGVKIPTSNGATSFDTAIVRGHESDGATGSSSFLPKHIECDGPEVSHPGELSSVKKQLAAKESQIRHLQDKLHQVEATIISRTTENEDRDFRLSLMENSNYDGTMLWKIPQFSQRMEDARTGKYTSIFSLPFYSGRYGYKMCLRLYILGDGIGKTTHMSLFFVLMKGEFDNILQWPFTHKVTFRLINQCGSRDVMDVFQPDPLSSSFQKPKSDMNIASGCPRFVSLNELMQNGFILDDTVFIKVKVDTTTMKHP